MKSIFATCSFTIFLLAASAATKADALVDDEMLQELWRSARYSSACRKGCTFTEKDVDVDMRLVSSPESMPRYYLVTLDNKGCGSAGCPSVIFAAGEDGPQKLRRPWSDL
jgi:hypothetical protein